MRFGVRVNERPIENSRRRGGVDTVCISCVIMGGRDACLILVWFVLICGLDLQICWTLSLILVFDYSISIQYLFNSIQTEGNVSEIGNKNKKIIPKKKLFSYISLILLCCHHTDHNYTQFFGNYSFRKLENFWQQKFTLMV